MRPNLQAMLKTPFRPEQQAIGLRFTLLFLLMALGTSAVLGAPAKERFHSLESASVWMTSYYRHPEPTHLPELLYTWGKEVSQEEGTIFPVAMFLAEAVRKAGAASAKSLLEAAERSNNWQTKNLALIALWLEDSEVSRQLLNHAAVEWNDDQLTAQARDMLSDSPQRLLKPNSTQASQDRAWAAFYASGNRFWVERVAQAATEADTALESEREAREYAVNTLAANAAHDEHVRAILNDFAYAATGDVADQYRRILSLANGYLQPGTAVHPRWSGDFGPMRPRKAVDAHF